MKRHTFPIVTTLFIATVAHPAITQARTPALATVIRDYARKHAFNGTILIDRKGQRIYHNSFGVADRAFNVPITNHTKYRIASITKAFTSVLVLQLYEQGKLDLHATIKDYLSDHTGEGADRVTIHTLLNHTSGIQNTDTVKSYEEAVRNGVPIYQLPHTTDELLARYCSGKLVHEVGKAFDYNNADYIILGKIIEKCTGKPYEQALKERILEPLGMKDSGMLYQQDIVSHLANTYFKRDNARPLINDLPVYMQNWYAAGGMYSTTTDLLKFAKALYGSKLLKPETLGLMLKPGLDSYGYGIWVFNLEIGGKQYRVAQRPGRIMGANVVLLRFLDEDLTIIILSNTNATDIDAFSFLIGRTLID